MALIKLFEPTDIKAVTFPNGRTFEVGGDDPHDDGIVIAITSLENGFEITGSNRIEGYSYTINENGIPVEEELSDWDSED